MKNSFLLVCASWPSSCCHNHAVLERVGQPMKKPRQHNTSGVSRYKAHAQPGNALFKPPARCTPWLTRTSSTTKKKPRYQEDSGVLFYLGWLMGLEPTTTGITILDSTN